MSEKLNIFSLYFQANKTKITGLVALAVALGLLSQLVFPILTTAASSPAFNMFSPYVRTQTKGHDYYLINVKNETEGGAWTGNVNAKAGDTLLFYLYYHNGENNTTARNTTIKVNLPSSAAIQHTISASLWADNATNATQSNPFRQSVQAGLNDSQKLEFIPGSVKWFPNQTDWMTGSPSSIPGGQPETNLFTSGINIGNIEGCWEFSGAIMFKLKVSQIQYNASLTIDKKMKNISAGDYNWTDGPLNNTSPQQTLGVQIEIKNTGNSQATNVNVQDILPSRLYYRPGTTKVDGVSVNDGIVYGYSLGTIEPGQTKTIYFETNLGIEREFSNPRGNFSMTNTATVSATNISQLQDSVIINGSYNGCSPQSEGMPARM
jgi:uncharacterized repeat protein (TIGR01451 family)